MGRPFKIIEKSESSIDERQDSNHLSVVDASFNDLLYEEKKVSIPETRNTRASQISSLDTEQPTLLMKRTRNAKGSMLGNNMS